LADPSEKVIRKNQIIGFAGVCPAGPQRSERACPATTAHDRGPACGYNGGPQRDQPAALGPRYDLKAFNDTVVRGGNVPLDVLASNVDEYLRR
jgi:hypothetical protein